MKLTQEVIELRHEMYFAERASKKYKYTGNGRAVKMNDIIKYNGNLETSDGLDISIVQENKEDVGSLLDYEIYNIGNEVALGEKSQGDLSKSKQKNSLLI